ncbi:MAG: site-2 protease family protein [Micrococcales bacterium]|nr:site-2 protease family protein [Micrococcales bacterium]
MSQTGQSSGLQLGRIGGVPLILTWSWALVAVFLVWIYLPSLARAWPDVPDSARLVMVLGLVACLFVSVLVHELAHGLAGRAVGVRPREYVMTFWGGHTSFDQPMPRPAALAVISASGPVANLALAGAVYLAGLLANPAAPLAGQRPSYLVLVASFAIWINLFVGIFNLIPGAPLDGGGLVEALVWAATGRRQRGLMAAGVTGLVTAVGIVVWGVWRQTQSAGYESALWPVLIALLVGQGAYAALRQGRALDRFEAFSVAGLSMAAVALPQSTNLAGAQATLAGGGQATWVVVTDSQGQPCGVISPQAMAAVPADQRAELSLDAVMQALPGPWAVDQAAKGLDALRALAIPAQQVAYLPVVSGREVVGVLEMAKVRRIAGIGQASP